MAAPFILASNSPRRHALLAKAGYEFEVVVPAGSELADAQLSLRELTIANATRKANWRVYRPATAWHWFFVTVRRRRCNVPWS